MDDIESIFPDHLSKNSVLRLDNFNQTIVGNFCLAPKFIRLGIKRGIERGIERGLERGRRQGRKQAEIELVLKQLRHRLGSLTEAQEDTVRKLTIRSIEAIAEALLDFSSSADLDQWLLAHSK